MPRPRFLADEDLHGPTVRAVLRVDSTIEFETVQGLGLDGSDDADLLEIAEQAGWVVVSHDVNTMKAAAEFSNAKLTDRFGATA